MELNDGMSLESIDFKDTKIVSAMSYTGKANNGPFVKKGAKDRVDTYNKIRKAKQIGRVGVNTLVRVMSSFFTVKGLRAAVQILDPGFNKRHRKLN